ncbi:MAG: thrombospondin type 3 repeat-containing protein [Candidatus Altiarchaeota archaeon]
MPSKTDVDEDGVIDLIDNCPGVFNPDQLDLDGDLVGELCDNCPSSINVTIISNLGSTTGVIDCSECGNAWKQVQYSFYCTYGCQETTFNPSQGDSDGDGVGDQCDVCEGTAQGIGVNQYGCANCSDSDMVLEYHVKGHVSTNMGMMYVVGNEDYCTNQGLLVEYYCGVDQSVKNQTYDCEWEGKICSDGKCCVDWDKDGSCNQDDNCPEDANPLQEDDDNDYVGDGCDNCPQDWNTWQYDFDFDGVGDPCDNCMKVKNANQEDGDGDGAGDLCDNCISDSNANQTDVDGDGIGDACDNCPQDYDPSQTDTDADGVEDACDNCPFQSNPGQEDDDGDGVGNVCKPVEGDINVVSVDAVQVIYDVPLVEGKNTVFRVHVLSSFPTPVNVSLTLDLPAGQWDLPDEVFNGDSKTFEVEVHHGMNRIFLPTKEYAPFDESKNEEGFKQGEDAGDWYSYANPYVFYPEVRLLPRPKSSKVQFSVSAELMPGIWEEYGAIPIEDVNDANDQRESVEYDVVRTRRWDFLVTNAKVINDDGTECEPPTATVEDLEDFEKMIRKQLGYALGTFPIADDKISFSLAQVGAVYDKGGGESRGHFLGEIADAAVDNGYDFGIVLLCGGGGGGASGKTKAVLFSASDSYSILAHEFNHAVTGMSDFYTLDCFHGWNEAYCELDGDTRINCCYTNSEDKNAPYCTQDFDGPEEVYIKQSNGELAYVGTYIDVPPIECWGSFKKHGSGGVCDHYIGSSKDYSSGEMKEYCENVTDCDGQGGKLYSGWSDTRAIHPTPSGFWTNKWVEIDSDEELFRYFMDGGTSTSVQPKYWMVRENTVKHCTGEVFNDGYLNLLELFEDPDDPEILSVRGYVNKDGTAKFDRFKYLGNGTTSWDLKEKGAYYIVLLDSEGGILGKYGFTPFFYQSEPEGGEVKTTYFNFNVEWNPDARRIELRNDHDKTVAVKLVSENKPEVTVGTVKSRVSPGEKAVISWRGSDDDDDMLTYSLSISSDGKRWVPLASNTVETLYELDTRGLAAGDYLMRVIATDGANSVEEIVNLKVEEKMPKQDVEEKVVPDENGLLSGIIEFLKSVLGLA